MPFPFPLSLIDAEDDGGSDGEVSESAGPARGEERNGRATSCRRREVLRVEASEAVRMPFPLCRRGGGIGRRGGRLLVEEEAMGMCDYFAQYSMESDLHHAIWERRGGGKERALESVW